MNIRARFESAPLPNGELREGWAALSHRWVDSRSQRRLNHSRWVRIARADVHTHAPVFRALRFAPNLRADIDTGVGEIAIDWAGWVELSDRETDGRLALDLRVRLAYPWESLWAALWHPDPTHRLTVA